MRKITMADYYNTQAVLQQNKALKDPYECNLFDIFFALNYNIYKGRFLWKL